MSHEQIGMDALNLCIPIFLLKYNNKMPHKMVEVVVAFFSSLGWHERRNAS